VWVPWLRRLLRYKYIPLTSTEMADSCLAEPGRPCCNRSGILPVRIEIIHSNIIPFPWLRRRVITINIPTSYTVLLFSDVKSVTSYVFCVFGVL